MQCGTERRGVLHLAPKPAPQAVNARQAAAAAETGSLFAAVVDRPKIFSRIAEWAETFLPAPPEPLELNPSAVDSYRKCPQKYLFSYLWSLQEKRYFCGHLR